MKSRIWWGLGWRVRWVQCPLRSAERWNTRWQKSGRAKIKKHYQASKWYLLWGRFTSAFLLRDKTICCIVTKDCFSFRSISGSGDNYETRGAWRYSTALADFSYLFSARGRAGFMHETSRATEEPSRQAIGRERRSARWRPCRDHDLCGAVSSSAFWISAGDAGQGWKAIDP